MNNLRRKWKLHLEFGDSVRRSRHEKAIVGTIGLKRVLSVRAKWSGEPKAEKGSSEKYLLFTARQDDDTRKQ